jgi:hypothetical protein
MVATLPAPTPAAGQPPAQQAQMSVRLVESRYVSGANPPAVGQVTGVTAVTNRNTPSLT